MALDALQIFSTYLLNTYLFSSAVKLLNDHNDSEWGAKLYSNQTEPSAPESSTITTRLPSHTPQPYTGKYHIRPARIQPCSCIAQRTLPLWPLDTSSCSSRRTDSVWRHDATLTSSSDYLLIITGKRFIIHSMKWCHRTYGHDTIAILWAWNAVTSGDKGRRFIVLFT